MVIVTIADEAALGPVARALAATLPAHAFLSLDGDLGAGKTTFVKALAAAADLYRLAGCDDLFELGWEELTAAPGWVAAEWSKRIKPALPADRLDILLEVESETARRASFTGRGAALAPLLTALRALPGASSG
jgi:tRNA threonylcarbamoyladenosine biosynthesis protein TsaE